MVKISNPGKREFSKIYELTGKIDGLVQHEEHVFKIMIDHFGDSFFIAEEIDEDSGEEKLMGYMMGFVSQKMHGLLFVWQIGVSPDAQGKGIGKALLQRTIEYARFSNCKGVIATVETDNIASQKLFEKLNFHVATKRFREPQDDLVKVDEKDAIADYYGSGTDQIWYIHELM